MNTTEFTYIKSPLIVEIFPTMKCTVHCAYCDRGEDDSEITDFSDCKSLLESLITNPLFQSDKKSLESPNL